MASSIDRVEEAERLLWHVAQIERIAKLSRSSLRVSRRTLVRNEQGNPKRVLHIIIEGA